MADEATAPIAERIRLGERAAERELVDRFYARIYAMALARTGDPELARDICQETMLAVLLSLREGRLRNSDALTAYVCSIARNRISSHFRSSATRFEAPLPGDLEGALGDPEEAFELAERRRIARGVLERLSPEDRRILYLTCFDDLKPRDIAARFRIRASALRMRKTRAIRRAREAFEEELLRSGRQRDLESEP